MKGLIKGINQQGKTRIHFKLDILIFNEGDTTIVYCPSLDLSGYGLSETEAKESLEIVLSEYFRYTLNKKTLKEDLQRLGWKIRSSSKPIEPPSLQQLLSENENFSRIFNSYDFRKTITEVELPAIA